jgi:hypothetical protein
LKVTLKVARAPGASAATNGAVTLKSLAWTPPLVIAKPVSGIFPEFLTVNFLGVADLPPTTVPKLLVAAPLTSPVPVGCSMTISALKRTDGQH